jgi:heme-degrading monooxygenase HmoA
MAVLMELDFDATPDQYDAVDAALDGKGNPPDGLIAHTARQAGDKMHIVDVWESEAAFGAFAESRLGPTIAEALGDDAPDAPQPKFTELHNAYKG